MRTNTAIPRPPATLPTTAAAIDPLRPLLEPTIEEAAS